MEWWSSGVMREPVQIEIRVFAFADTPILQYSSTPKQLAFLPAEPCNADLAQRTSYPIAKYNHA
jgi:hypothetical protein